MGASWGWQNWHSNFLSHAAMARYTVSEWVLKGADTAKLTLTVMAMTRSQSGETSPWAAAMAATISPNSE